MNDFYKNLISVEKALEKYFDPENRDGFVYDFVSWVIDDWGYSNYIKDWIIQHGQDRVTFPMVTNYSLKEKVNTYPEYLNSYAFVDDQKSEPEKKRDMLVAYITRCKMVTFDEFAIHNDLVLPKKMKKAHVTLKSFVFLSRQDMMTSQEWAWCERFRARFGITGSFIKMYLHNSIFASFTYKDFVELKDSLDKKLR